MKAGTVQFIAKLKGRRFPDPADDDVMLIFTDGFELEVEALEETQFSYPILILNSEGLDLKVPPNSFSIQDVEDHIGN